MKRPTTATRPIEPVQPQPEQFGLTVDRVNSFKKQPFPRVICFLAICFSVPVVVIIIKSLGASLWWLLYPLTWFPIFFVVTFFTVCFAAIVNSFRVKRSPDAEAHERYSASLKVHRVAVEAYRQQLDLWQRSQLAWWRSLSGRGFEHELAKLLKARGYRVELTPVTNDGGVDLILQKGTQSILVQCKAHKNPVGPGPVRDLFGTFTHRGGTAAWLVSTSSFTKGANNFASGKPIRLVPIAEILNEDWNHRP